MCPQAYVLLCPHTTLSVWPHTTICTRPQVSVGDVWTSALLCIVCSCTPFKRLYTLTRPLHDSYTPQAWVGDSWPSIYLCVLIPLYMCVRILLYKCRKKKITTILFFRRVWETLGLAPCLDPIHSSGLRSFLSAKDGVYEEVNKQSLAKHYIGMLISLICVCSYCDMCVALLDMCVQYITTISVYNITTISVYIYSVC